MIQKWDWTEKPYFLTPLDFWAWCSHCLKWFSHAGFLLSPLFLFTWKTGNFPLVSLHLNWRLLPDHSHFPRLDSFLLPWAPIVPWASFSLWTQIAFVGEIKYDTPQKNIWAYGSQGYGLTMLCDSGMKEMGIKVCWVLVLALPLMSCIILLSVLSVILPLYASISPFDGRIGLKDVSGQFQLWNTRIFLNVGEEINELIWEKKRINESHPIITMHITDLTVKNPVTFQPVRYCLLFTTFCSVLYVLFYRSLSPSLALFHFIAASERQNKHLKAVFRSLFIYLF